MLALSRNRPFASGVRRASARPRTAIGATNKMKVAVTGAAGRTGALICKKLAERSQDFELRAIVRNSNSKPKLTAVGVPESSIYEVDLARAATSPEVFASAFQGCDALVVATSAVPVLQPLSLIRVFWAKITGGERVMPSFSWKEGQSPEQVDWLGQKAQVDAARSAGIKKVVVVSSMGGTDKDNNLNKLGDNGNILQWKRKAEQYLIASGLTYTIIHPGGLIDEPGGERELVVDVDDLLLKEPLRTLRSIPRADVAELAVQCLIAKAAENRSFDVLARKPGDGAPTKDFEGLLTAMSANCDYSINSQM